jgi:hypothetical protein
MLYLDCPSGISGNMLLGALAELGVGEEALRKELASLGLAGWNFKTAKVQRGALSATLVEVEVTGTQAHRSLQDILALIDGSSLPAGVKEKSKQVFQRLAQAEAEVHGTSPEQVHFHEVGAVDAIIDIVGAVAGLHRLGVERVVCSPLPVARGWVESSHGPLPLPAPATALLLRGAPTYGVEGEFELVTPTGAALAVTLADSYGPQPPMTVQSVGCGAGSADLPKPNILRAFLGETTQASLAEKLILLETNIDDMNPELYENLMEQLFAAGALEVYFTPIIMKKSRPGVVISALCEAKDKAAVLHKMFEESTTLGVRIIEVERHCLPREFREIETRWGKVKVKLARTSAGIVTASPEYEDCKRLAREHRVPLRQVYEEAKALAWQAISNNL